jgi:hypothetical protein
MTLTPALALALVAVLAGCAGNSQVVAPVVDLPSNLSASPFPLKQIKLAVAHDGATDDVTSATFSTGQAVELAGVPFGEDLVVHMTGFVGTTDFAYGRTCSFAVSQAETPTPPHLYFSRSKTFGQLAYKPLTRVHGMAITYHDGSGLLVGGQNPNDDHPVTDIERLDPRTGEFRLLATVEPRVGVVAAPIGTGDGQVVLVGGVDMTGVGAQFVELITVENAADRRVERSDATQIGRIDFTATALTDGRVITIGGKPPGGSATTSVEEISSSNGIEVRTAHAILAHARSGHTATRLGDDVGAKVLVAGGVDDSVTPQPVADAELFKPLTEVFAQPFVAKMLYPRHHHQAVRMPDGSVLFLGGLDGTNTPVPTIEQFTLEAGFSNVGRACEVGTMCAVGVPCTTGACPVDLPPNVGVVDFTATPLPNGCVLITGGRRFSAGAPLDSAVFACIDPAGGPLLVLSTDHMTVARASHQATLMCDGTVLVAGGTTDPSAAERYNPAGRRP